MATAPQATRFRLAVVVVVVLAPLLWWTKVAFLSAATEMLPPSWCGDWIVHPDWNIDYAPDATTLPPVAYRLEVPVGALASHPLADVTVMGSFRVRLDEADCGLAERRGTWRHPVTVDLASCAGARLGNGADSDRTLELMILAQNATGPAPARVCWRADAPLGASVLPASGDDGWWAVTPGRPWRPAAIAGRGNSEMLDKNFTWPRGPWGYRVLLAALILLAWVALLRRGPSAGNGGDSPPAHSEWPSYAVLATISVVYLWNASVYPWQASHIDQEAHAERLRYAAEHVIPAPIDSSFQAYQPPLYYGLAGGLLTLLHPGEDLTLRDDPEDLRPAQLLDALVGITNLWLVWWFLRRYGPASRRARVLALAITGLAPVVLTTYPMLGNETLSGFLCGAALVAGIAWLPTGRIGTAAVAGTLAALALLTKYTGLMPVAALILMLAARWFDLRLSKDGDTKLHRSRARTLAISAATWGLPLALLAGPFYLGRWLRWGSPFIGNWEPSLGLVHEAEPGYRTLGFFTRFGELFFYSPERGLWSSFWDGLYVSTWAEVNDSFLPFRDPAVDALLLVLLAFAVVPTLAALYGLAGSARRAARSRPGLDLACLAVTVFSLASVAVYALQVPFNSTVKALYLISLSAPGALFMARGYERMQTGLGSKAWLLDLITSLQLLLTLRLFVWQS